MNELHLIKCVGCGGRGCSECDDLGAIFNTVVLRGYPHFEGETVVIEGHPTVHLEIVHGAVCVRFIRLCEDVPPNFFVKEDGKQVYLFVDVIE